MSNVYTLMWNSFIEGKFGNRLNFVSQRKRREKKQGSQFLSINLEITHAKFTLMR